MVAGLNIFQILSGLDLLGEMLRNVFQPEGWLQ